MLLNFSSFGILSYLDIPQDLLGASISISANFLYSTSVHLHASEPYNVTLFTILLFIYHFLCILIALYHHMPFSLFTDILPCPILPLIPFVPVQSNCSPDQGVLLFAHTKVFCFSGIYLQTCFFVFLSQKKNRKILHVSNCFLSIHLFNIFFNCHVSISTYATNLTVH